MTNTVLKRGGFVLFRDYGRYCMTQLRFKGGRLPDENFIPRATKLELSLLFTSTTFEPGPRHDANRSQEVQKPQPPIETANPNPQPPQFHSNLPSPPPPALCATEQLDAA
ncbi:hypothetical protein K438DRAFT_1961567 [Mycena galopus ATCC 62051]|nr:hypothetical protein K438DRAFT_1961567 [Mycena galopus ATCC 62051]